MKLMLREENIATLIYFVRGEKVMLDSDLANLYGVETKVLKQAVKRNLGRFPDDFLFLLSKAESDTLWSQFVTIKRGRGQHSKYLPFAFTEQGVAMLSGVLKSKRAIEVNIAVMRTFVQIRHLLTGNKAIAQKIKGLEALTSKRFDEHDEKFRMIFEAIRQLIQQKNEPREPIGFKIEQNS